MSGILPRDPTPRQGETDRGDQRRAAEGAGTVEIVIGVSFYYLFSITEYTYLTIIKTINATAAILQL